MCFFPLGYAALSLCLPDLGLMLDHSGLCQRHVGLMLNHFGVFCGFVGFCWARLGTVLALSWATLDYVGTFWGHVGSSGILLFVLAFVGQELGPCLADVKK